MTTNALLLDDALNYAIITAWPSLPQWARDSGPVDLTSELATRINFKGPKENLLYRVRMLLDLGAIYQTGARDPTIEEYLRDLAAAKRNGVYRQGGTGASQEK